MTALPGGRAGNGSKPRSARLFEAHKGKRGSPMITADLHDAGWRVSKNTVAALMAEMGLAARPKRRRKGTTRPGKGRWKAPDLVRRDFPAAAINVKWYGDGTDIHTERASSTWTLSGITSPITVSYPGD